MGPASGGRGLAAFVPVTPGRPLTVRLHQVLRAAREAIDRARAAGGTHAFDEAVEAGVSHELTEALAALVQGTRGARVAVAWAPAAGSPRAAQPAPSPSSSPPAICPCCARPGTATCGPNRPSRCGSPARWYG